MGKGVKKGIHPVIVVLAAAFFYSGGSAAMGFSMEEPVIHGFISQGYMKSDENNFMTNSKDGSFQFNEMGINFTTYLQRDLFVGLQFFARDLGDLGNDEVVLDWAIGDYHFRDWLGFRVGKLKMPIGLYNETRDIDMLRTSVILPQGVYNEGWRDTFSTLKGGGIYGTLTKDAVGSITYQAQVGIIEMDTDDGASKYLEDRLSIDYTKHYPDTVLNSGLQWSTPLQGLKLGMTTVDFEYKSDLVTRDSFLWRNLSVLAFYRSTGMLLDYDNVLANGFTLVGLPMQMNWEVKNRVISLEYIRNKFMLAAEYFYTKGTFEILTAQTGDKIIPRRTDYQEGFYVSLSYRINPLVEAGLYYTEYYPVDEDKDGKMVKERYDFPEETAWLKDTCLSLRFDITPNWTCKLEGHIMDGAAVMFIRDQESLDAIEKDWFLFAAKMTFNF